MNLKRWVCMKCGKLQGTYNRKPNKKDRICPDCKKSKDEE